MQPRFLPACSRSLPFPSRKADEGLATISEDGRSPISLKQMAYGEREPGQGLGTPWPLCAPGSGTLGFQRAAAVTVRPPGSLGLPDSLFCLSLGDLGSGERLRALRALVRVGGDLNDCLAGDASR